jgi:hypothetical protein
MSILRKFSKGAEGNPKRISLYLENIIKGWRE